MMCDIHYHACKSILIDNENEFKLELLMELLM